MAAQIPHLQTEVDLIVTSPLTRTMQTTKLGWGPAVERLGISNVICLPQAQECNGYPCDTGRSREQLEQDPDFQGCNLSMLTPDWTSKEGFWGPDSAAVANRAKWVRQYLRERPEKNIVLVAHGDILRAVTSSPDGFSSYPWRNAECRIYTFDERYVDTDDCFLYEEKAVVAAGGYERTSTEADLMEAASNGKM